MSWKSASMILCLAAMLPCAPRPEPRAFDRARLAPYLEYGRRLKTEAEFVAQSAQVKNHFFTLWERDALDGLMRDAAARAAQTPDAAGALPSEAEARAVVASWEAELTAILAEEYGAFKARLVSSPPRGILEALTSALNGAVAQADLIRTDELSADLEAWRTLLDEAQAKALQAAQAESGAHFDSLRESTDLDPASREAFLQALSAREADESRCLLLAADMVRERAFNAWRFQRTANEASASGGGGAEGFAASNLLVTYSFPSEPGALPGVAFDASLTQDLSSVLGETGIQLASIDPAEVNITTLRDDYQNRVRNELEGGLARWDAAALALENAFRTWMQDSAGAYADEYRAWQDALARFSTRQRDWRSTIDAQILSGEALWQTTLSRLSNQVAMAQSEMVAVLKAREADWGAALSALDQSGPQAASLYEQLRQSALAYEGLIRSQVGKIAVDTNQALSMRFGKVYPGTFTGPESAPLDARSYFESVFSMGLPALDLADPRWGLAYADRIETHLTDRTGFPVRILLNPAGTPDAFHNPLLSGIEPPFTRWFKVEQDYFNWTERLLWTDRYLTNSVQPWIDVRWDETANTFRLYGMEDWNFKQIIWWQKRVDASSPLGVDRPYEVMGGGRNFSLTYTGGSVAGISDELVALCPALGNLLFYQQQLARCRSLMQTAAALGSQLLSSWNTLFFGQQTGDGLLFPTGDPDDLFWKDPLELERAGLEAQLDEARFAEIRAGKVLLAWETQCTQASAIGSLGTSTASPEYLEAETEWKAAAAAASNALSVLNIAQDGAAAHFSNVYLPLADALASASLGLSSKRGVYDAASRAFASNTARFQAGTLSLAAYREQCTVWESAQAAWDAANQALADAQRRCDLAQEGWFSLLREARGAQLGYDGHRRTALFKEDVLNTLAHAAFLDGASLSNELIASKAACSRLTTELQQLAQRMAQRASFRLENDHPDLWPSLTAQYEKLMALEDELAAVKKWAGPSFIDPNFWNALSTGWFENGPPGALNSLVDPFGSNNGSLQGYDPGALLYAAPDEAGCFELLRRFMGGERLSGLEFSFTLKSNASVLQANVTRIPGIFGLPDKFITNLSWKAWDHPDTNLSVRLGDVDRKFAVHAVALSNDHPGAWPRLMGAWRFGFSPRSSPAELATALGRAITTAKSRILADESLVATAIAEGASNALVSMQSFHADYAARRLDLSRRLLQGREGGEAFAMSLAPLAPLADALHAEILLGQQRAQALAIQMRYARACSEYGLWTNQVYSIHDRGELAWDREAASLAGAFGDWQNRNAEATALAREAWQARFLQLGAHRQSWAEAARDKVLAGQVAAYESDLRRECDDLVGRLFENLPGPVEIGGTSLRTRADVLARVESLSRMALSPLLASRGLSLPYTFTLTELGTPRMNPAAGLLETLTAMMKETEALTSAVQAAQFWETLEANRKSRESAINALDLGTEEGLRQQLQAAGYVRSGASWTRRVVVGSTAWGDTIQGQTVTGYQRHATVLIPNPLSRDQLMREAPAVALSLIRSFQEQIARVWSNYMGDDSLHRLTEQEQALTPAERGAMLGVGAIQTAIGAQILGSDALQGPDGAFLRGGKRYQMAESPELYGQALMYRHIGRAPVFDEGGEDPMFVRLPGLGQLGAIMTDIRRNALQARRGESEAAKPAWLKKLWEDDPDYDGKRDSIIAAPNLMSVATIATALIPGAGPAISAGVSTLGTMATGAFYGRDAASIVLDVGKGLATAALGAATGGLGNTILGAASTTLLGNMASAGISSLASSSANALVNAVDLKDGQLTFNTSAAYWQQVGQGALQSLAMGVVSSGVSYGVNKALGGTLVRTEIMQRDKTGALVGSGSYASAWNFQRGGTLLNSAGRLAQDLGAVGTFAGSMSSSLLGTLAFKQDFKLNAGGLIDLNLSKLTRGDSTGIIEAGNTGLRADLALGALRGLSANAWLTGQESLAQSGYGKIAQAALARVKLVDTFSVASHQGANAHILDQILGGDVAISFGSAGVSGDMSSRGLMADVLGNASRFGKAGTVDGRKTILLNEAFLSSGDSINMLGLGASVIAHEGFHLNDESTGPQVSREVGAYRDQAETYLNLKKSFGNSLEVGMLTGMAAALQSGEKNFTEYLAQSGFDLGDGRSREERSQAPIGLPVEWYTANLAAVMRRKREGNTESDFDGVEGGEDSSVNWKMIRKWESSILSDDEIKKMYVPLVSGVAIENSGVTVGPFGFDIGQRSSNEIANYDVLDSLKTKLFPATSLKRDKAISWLLSNSEANPKSTTLTDDELTSLTGWQRTTFEKSLSEGFDKLTHGNTTWANLPSEAQTVAMSIYIQYGPSSLNFNLMKQFRNSDFRGAVNNLLDFQPGIDPSTGLRWYQQRRAEEAQILYNVVKPNWWTRVKNYFFNSQDSLLVKINQQINEKPK